MNNDNNDKDDEIDEDIVSGFLLVIVTVSLRTRCMMGMYGRGVYGGGGMLSGGYGEGGMMGSQLLMSINQFLFGIQSVVFSLGQAVQLVGMNGRRYNNYQRVYVKRLKLPCDMCRRSSLLLDITSVIILITHLCWWEG
jgi:hypothetical protein